MTAFALKIKHGIDHMFQNPRSGNRALFGDMTDEKQHETFLFGQFDQFIGTGAHLRNAAGGRFRLFQIHGLDRIYYHDRCSGLFQRGDDVFDVGGRGQIDRRRFQPQPAGADFDLIGRLFARNVVAFRPFGQVGDAGTDLQQQSRFADTGIAADQNDRTGHQPAAANAVKLADVGMQTLKHLRRTA